MPSDSERREVAENLRYLTIVGPPCVPHVSAVGPFAKESQPCE